MFVSIYVCNLGMKLMINGMQSFKNIDALNFGKAIPIVNGKLHLSVQVVSSYYL